MGYFFNGPWVLQIVVFNYNIFIDGSTTQLPQRKPIVWSKKSGETPSTTDTATSSTSQGLLVPPRGRTRARRVRYAAAAAYAGRGRGEIPWGSPGRRGRGTTRRRSMYWVPKELLNVR